jgi:hypothetical protein
MDELKRSIKQAVEQVRAAAEQSDSGDVAHVNVAGRKNVVVSGSIGEPGGTHGASSKQRVRIRQRNGETEEVTETTTEEWHGG